MLLSIFATLLLSSRFLLSKAAIDIAVLDYVAEYYDPDYFKDIETSVWDNNIFVNLTITDYLPMNATVKLELLRATMGEYIIKTGVEMQLPLCEAMEDPVFGAEILQQYKPPMEECPPKPGTYITDDNIAELGAYSDTFASGHYLMKTLIYTPEKLLLELRFYARIS